MVRRQLLLRGHLIRGVEYAGWVVKRPNGKYSVTVRRDGTFWASIIDNDDIPQGMEAAAIWHTHLPLVRLAVKKDADGKLYYDKDLGEALKVVEGFADLFRAGHKHFSGADKHVAAAYTALLKRGRGQIPIYLATATLIRRYKPRSHGKNPENQWAKELPSRMAAKMR